MRLNDKGITSSGIPIIEPPREMKIIRQHGKFQFFKGMSVKEQAMPPDIHFKKKLAEISIKKTASM